MNRLFLILILAVNLTCFDARAQSPEQKTSDEYKQKVSEVEEKQKLIAENNRKIKQALMDGAKAYDEKNYRLALAKFDEGFNLSPDYWGTAPVMLNNKAMALIQLGVENYNNALKAKQNPKLESNRFFLDAIGFLKRSREILGTAPLPEDEAGRVQVESTNYVSLRELAQAYRLLVLTDETRAAEAIEAFENYLKIETDPSLKAKAQENLQKIRSKFKIN